MRRAPYAAMSNTLWPEMLPVQFTIQPGWTRWSKDHACVQGTLRLALAKLAAATAGTCSLVVAPRDRLTWEIDGQSLDRTV